MTPGRDNLIRESPHRALLQNANESSLGRLRFKRRLAQIKSHEQIKEQDPLALAFDNHLETGFQLATFQGPLCAEPVEGMAYFVEALALDREGIEQEQGM